MSARPEDGGPAYPNVPEGAGNRWSDWDKGMSLRDHFAGLALAALIGHESKDYCTRGKNAVPMLARFAYEYADAMITERAKDAA